MALAGGLRALLDASPGGLTLGPFQLGEQLGRGGFAPVFRAVETFDGEPLRDVAVKLFVLDDGTAGDAQRAAIVREARALCRVDHPSCVRFLSIAADAARGLVGLVMEHVRGRSLDVRIVEQGRLSFEEVLAIAIAVAGGLEAAHARGVVHRDVKPANVVSRAGGFTVVDFGIAASASGAGVDAPKRRVVLGDVPLESGTRLASLSLPTGDAHGPWITGTLGYVDPEIVASGGAADASSDLYGLGATLFDCATGLVPASASLAETPTTCEGLRGEILDGRASPPELVSLRPDFPRAFCELVDALLLPSRARRPSSAAEVRRKFERIRLEWELAGRPRGRTYPLLPLVAERALSDLLCAAADDALLEATRRLATSSTLGEARIARAALVAGLESIDGAASAFTGDVLRAVVRVLLACSARLASRALPALRVDSHFVADASTFAQLVFEQFEAIATVDAELDDQLAALHHEGAASAVIERLRVVSYGFTTRACGDLMARLRSAGAAPRLVGLLAFLERALDEDAAVRASHVLTTIFAEMRERTDGPAPGSLTARPEWGEVVEVVVDTLGIVAAARHRGEDGAERMLESALARVFETALDLPEGTGLSAFARDAFAAVDGADLDRRRKLLRRALQTVLMGRF